MNYLNYKRWKR